MSCVRSCLAFFSCGGEAAPLIHTDGRRIKRGFSRHSETYRPIYYSCRNRKASNAAFGLMRKCDRPTARGHRCVPEYFEIEFERQCRRTQRAPAQQNGPAMRGLGEINLLHVAAAQFLEYVESARLNLLLECSHQCSSVTRIISAFCRRLHYPVVEIPRVYTNLNIAHT